MVSKEEKELFDLLMSCEHPIDILPLVFGYLEYQWKEDLNENGKIIFSAMLNELNRTCK